MFGSHLSVAGGIANALRDAQTLDLDCVQIFTKNQQQWRVKPLEPDHERDWLDTLTEMGWAWDGARTGGRTVSHASYLINLGSPDPELRAKSIDLMTEEILRCERLGIPYLVHHPGSHKKTTVEEGIDRIADSYAQLFRRTAGYRTICCLENTVGGGSTIGRTFEELADLRDAICQRIDEPDRVGFCFDTCHAHSGGYDMSTRPKARGVLDHFDHLCSLDHLLVLHLNDCKVKMGARIDRHEHIGLGTIGIDGFKAVVNHKALQDRPKIMETPKGEADDGTPWDSANLAALQALMPKSARRVRTPG